MPFELSELGHVHASQSLEAYRMSKKKRPDKIRDVPLDDLKQGPMRHKKGLTPLLEEIARAIYSKVGHLVYPTFEQWELGFMRDLHPWREILIWENIARTFDHYLATHPEAANDEKVVSTIAIISTGHVSESETENEKELRKLYLEAFKNKWTPLFGEPVEFSPGQALVLKYRNIIDEWDGGFFPNLRGKDDCRRILADADIILGMDSMSEETFCIYGRDRLEEGRIPKGLKTVIVRMDPENQKTHELEKMCFVVERIKGRHDCQ
jgi:hypothetical protein